MIIGTMPGGSSIDFRDKTPYRIDEADANTTYICWSDTVAAQLVVRISKSGTVVQECTLLTKPVICVYKVPDWQAWFARKVLKFSMPFYSLPNLLSGMAIIPELIQEDFTESNVLQKTRELLNISELHTKTVERLAKVRHMIAGEAAVVQAANRILQD